MGQLIIEHRSHDADRFRVAGVGIPRHNRIDELAERARRIALPIRALPGFGVEHGIDQIDLQSGFGIVVFFAFRKSHARWSTRS